MTQEQAFYKMMYKEDNEIDNFRVAIKDFLNADMSEKDLLLFAELKKCDICGYVGLEEVMHENEDGVYCDTCWEAR